MKNKEEYNILWSIICFLFIAFLCLIFNSANPLWLLILWLLGVKLKD